MGWLRTASLLLVCTGWCLGQFRALPGGRKASEDFDCVEEFGYYPHPTDCSRYYVCVFGGALEESCSSGLVYSIELQTCDWPRNVASCDPKTGTPRPQLSRSRGHSSRGPSKATPAVQLVTTRRPNFRQPVRNALDGRTAAGSSVAERFRILDNIADRDRPFDFERAIEQDNNKIVARRQQKLLSADSSGGRGRFQQPAVQSLQGNFRLKTTDPPVQISTISSFSFGDTGTRFPFRGSSAAPSTPAPPPRAKSHRPATLLPTRFPSRHSPSTFVGSTRTSVSPASRGPVTRRTIAFQPSTTPAPTRRQSLFTPAPTRRQSPTTPAFRQSPTAPARRQSPTTPAPARQGFTEPAYVAYFNDTIYDVYYIYDDDDVQYDEVDYPDVTASTPRSTTTASTTTTTTTRRPPPVTQIHTVFSQPKSTPARRRIPLFSLDNIRDSVLGKTAAGVNRPQNRPHKTAASPFSLGSSGGSTTLGAAFGTGSARGTTRGSHGSTRSGFKQTSQRTTAAAAERTRQRPSKSKLVTSSRRTPSTGLKSIDTSSSRRPSSPRLPKRPNALSKSSTTKVNIWAHPPYRPAPLYPQPVPDEPAERCDARCRLPDCNCGGTANPGGLTTAQTPQLVVVTFDDSVNDLNRDLYEEMFESGRTNPNGCPISGTFYVSHEWTNYKQVQNLYADGHEIASHSISHSFGEQFSTSKWEAEIAGQREILAAYGGVRMEDVRGMRAPFLSIGGNRMFKMLYNNNFTYDSSMPVYENNPPSWPYTLDYKIHHDCMIPPCPNKAYPGVWEVPMVMWQDLNGGRCSMVDACTAPSSAEEVYNMLIKNFQRHYSTNRAVLPLYFHAAWMTTKHHREGFMAFLDTISKMDDVWLVTNWQVIQWMRDPQPLSNINNFKPFGCSYPERPPRCVKAKKCNVWHKSGVRYMTTCQPCPQKYPWTGRTGVSKP